MSWQALQSLEAVLLLLSANTALQNIAKMLLVNYQPHMFLHLKYHMALLCVYDVKHIFLKMLPLFFKIAHSLQTGKNLASVSTLKGYAAENAHISLYGCNPKPQLGHQKFPQKSYICLGIFHCCKALLHHTAGGG